MFAQIIFANIKKSHRKTIYIYISGFRCMHIENHLFVETRQD